MPTVRIVDKFGEVVETKELEQFQIDVYRQAGYNITTLEETAIIIPSDIQQILTGIENGDYTVPQVFRDVEIVNIKNGNITPDRFRRQWAEGVNSGIIKSTIGTQIQSYTYSTPYGQFDTQATNEQEAFQAQQEFVQQKQQEEFEAQQAEIARQQEELRIQQEQAQQQTEIPSIIPSIPTAEALEQEQTSQVNYPMVSQLGVEFELKNNRVTGRVVLNKITSNWNPYYNDRNLISYFELKTPNGIAISSLGEIKQNVVKFPPSQPPLLPSQELTFDESAENYKSLQVRIYLWTEDNIAVAEPLVFTVKEDSVPIDVVNPSDATAGIKNDNFLAKGVGIFGGLLGISLLLTGLKSSNSRGK
jgi:hypothetical protein